jgi:hypothetical protein
VLLGAAAAVIALVVVLELTLGGGSSRRPPPAIHPVPSAPSLGPVAQPPPAAEQFGVNVNRLFNDQFGGHGYTPAQIDGLLGALAATGATVARSDALWQAAEPNPPAGATHRYDWTFADQIAATLAAHRLRWLPIVDYAPAWAASDPSKTVSPPRLPAAYAAYAGALASRYGPGGAFWRAHPELPAEPVQSYEIWNEPDNAQFWPPAPDGARYADLYVRARKAITAVQPDARVIVGGLTDIAHFIPAMLAARPGLGAHIDGVAIHPYGPTPAVVFSRVRGARSVLQQSGLGDVPLYVTEFGWTTRPPHSLGWAPARLRPRYLTTALATLAHSDCGIAAAILYTWVTPRLNPADHEDWYGIEPPAGGTSPDVAALTAAFHEAGASAPDVALCRG